jgi:hypothetical protein
VEGLGTVLKTEKKSGPSWTCSVWRKLNNSIRQRRFNLELFRCWRKSNLRCCWQPAGPANCIFLAI